MDIALLIFGLLAGAYLMRFVFPDGTTPSVVGPRLAIVRWVLLCAVTILATLLLIEVSLSRGRVVFRFFDDSRPVGLLAGVYAATTIFLLLASPFFFRRLRPLAVLSWLVAVLSAFWSLLPVY